MVDKKKRNTIAGIVVVGLLLILLSQGKIFPFATSPIDSTLPPCTNTDFKVLSASNVNIEKTGDRIRIFGAIQGGDCLRVQLKPSELEKSLSKIGLKATQPITVSFELIEFTRLFDIQKDGQFTKILTNKVLDNTKSVILGNWLDECKKKLPGEEILTAYKPIAVGWNIRCITLQKDGDAGILTGVTFDSFKIKVTANDMSDTLIVSGIKGNEPINREISLSEGKVKASFVGTFGGLSDISKPPYDARLIHSKWNLVESGAKKRIETFLGMKGQAGTFMSCLKISSYKSNNLFQDKNFDNCVKNFETYRVSELSDKINNYRLIPTIQTMTKKVDTTPNGLYVSINRGFAQIPTITLDLDASSFGIIELKPSPQITSCIPEFELESGISKSTSFKVSNNAPIGGDADIDLSCSGDVNIFAPDTIKLNPNEKDKTIPISITGNNIKPGTTQDVSCKLTIGDQSCSFSGSVEYNEGITCTKNKNFCGTDDNVRTCSSNGKSSTLKETCEFGCLPSTATCRLKEDENKGTGFFQKITDSITGFFGSLFSGTMGLLKAVKWFIIFLLSIISTFVSYDILERIKSIRNNKLIRWIISTAIGLGIGYILYLFIGGFIFWIIVASVIAYIIIISFFKRTPIGRALSKIRR